MIQIEIQVALSIAAVILAVAGLIYVRHIVRVSGRDRPSDPARVDEMVRRVRR